MPSRESSAPSIILGGRYRLTQLLGQGGMSRVYEAEDLRLGRRVAVKVITLGTKDDATRLERLFREAKGAARTEHPGVITIYGHGTDPEQGVSYLVMERLTGHDLAARLAREGRLAPALARRIGMEVADALAAAHAVGVVHRDLKPSNVFLASRGLRIDDVKLLDFGVARHLDLETLTHSGEVFGTLRYMAPEQLLDSHHADARADVYALGVVLYECLAGRCPFEAAPFGDLARQILAGDVPPLADHRPRIATALAHVVDRCMARRASDRFGSAAALRDALVACSP